MDVFTAAGRRDKPHLLSGLALSARVNKYVAKKFVCLSTERLWPKAQKYACVILVLGSETGKFAIWSGDKHWLNRSDGEMHFLDHFICASAQN